MSRQIKKVTRRGHRLEDFNKLEKLGEGAYGVVFKALNGTNGEVVALKRIICQEGIPSTAIREIAVLKDLQHPNIVRLLDVFMEERRLYMVFELVTMDLNKYLDCEVWDIASGRSVKSFCYQILQAILYCHQRGVMHRDLKPQNILVDQSGAIKVADFGLVRFTAGSQRRVFTHEVVTLWYRAPEILLGAKMHSCQIDIWSIGCIFAEMVNRNALFQGDSEIDQLFKIFRALRTPTEDIWPGVSQLTDFKITFPSWTTCCLENYVQVGENIDGRGLDLLKKMFDYDPMQRISAKKALLHPYFDDLDKSMLPAKPGEYEIRRRR